MSNAGSDFVHVAATRSIGHGTPSTSRSEPASADSEHIRIGRSLVKVKRYQNEASRGSRWPPTSPTSPASPTPLTPIPSPTEGTIQERAFKRKWFQPPFIRRRNVSLGGISPGGDDLLVPAKRGEIRSWVSGQPHHGMWVSASQDDLDVRPASATIHIREYESDRESAPTPTIHSAPSRPALSIGPYSDASSSIYTGDSFDTTGSSQRTSPPQNLPPQNEEDESEDGRILLEAMGLEDPTPAPEQADPLDQEQPQNNNLSDPTPRPDELAPEVPCVPTPFRPLPPIPSPPPSQPQAKWAVPPPRDSQDAYTCFFGPSPQSPQYRVSSGPPPRYSAILDRPGITSEEVAALQHLRSLGLPEVAPLEIRKRDDKTVQRDMIVNSEGA